MQTDRSQHRTRLRAGLVALVAAGALAGGAAPALAKKHTEVVRLVSVAEGTATADATGKLKITTSRRSEKAVLRVKHLAPRTVYEVRDRDTDELLGTFRTNRRGKGKFVMRASPDGTRRGKNATAMKDLPDAVEVAGEDGTTVLDGEREGEGDKNDPGFAFGAEQYEGEDGSTLFVGMSSFTHGDESAQSFSLSLMPPVGEDGFPNEMFEFHAVGEDLPLGVKTVAALAGCDFEVRDGDGETIVAGKLPELEEIECPEPPDIDDLPDIDWGDRDGPDRPMMPPMGGELPDLEELPDDLRRIVTMFAEGGEPSEWENLPEWDDSGWNDSNWNDSSWDEWEDEFAPPEGEESDVTLWIRAKSDAGELEKVAHLIRYELPDFVVCPMDGDWDGHGDTRGDDNEERSDRRR